MFHILSAGQILNAGGVVFVRMYVGDRVSEDFWGLWQSGFPEVADGMMQYCCTLWSVLWGFTHSLHCTVSQTQSI